MREGGIRVPGIVRWPGHVKPGTTSDQPVNGTDFFTTVCDIVDIPLPDDRTIDGASIRPVFNGESIERDQPLFWRCKITAPPTGPACEAVEDPRQQKADRL